jgi:hypothetical protein
LDFLGRGQFERESPRFWGLEKLGFPWILSSESSVFNGLRGIFAEEISRALLPKRRRQNGVHGGPGHADAKTYSPGKPSAISVFRQSIVARQKMATRQFSHTILQLSETISYNIARL